MCGRMVGNSLLMLWKNLMAKSPTLTTDSGAPVADNQNSLTAGPFGPVLIQDFHLLEKLAHQNRERIPERTVHAKGSGAYGTLTVTNDITKYTRAASALEGRQEDGSLPALLHRRRRAWCGGCRARRARLRAALLHRGGQLGHRRQQHAGVLRPRSAEISGLHPYPEAPSEDQPALADRDVGFLVAVAGKPAPGHHPDVRSRPAAELSQRRRFWLAHLFLHQRARRTALGEVSLQDHAGHQELDQCRGRREDRR